jgi:hypothetical protein
MHKAATRVGRPWRVAGSLAVIATVLTALAPSAANADLSYERKRFKVEPGEQSPTVRARCEDGRHVLSGGFGATLTFHVNRSMPFDGGDRGKKPDDGWEVSLSNLNPPGDSRTQAVLYAICSKSTPRYRVRRTTATGELSARVKCPRGSKATGVGGSTKGSGDETFLRALAPFEFGGARGRAVSVLAKGSSNAPNVALAAVCSDDLKLRYVRDTFSVPGPGDPTSDQSLRCRRKRQVAGAGGYPPTFPAGSDLMTEDSFPEDGRDRDRTVDDGWYFSAVDPAFLTQEVSLVAVCAR